MRGTALLRRLWPDLLAVAAAGGVVGGVTLRQPGGIHAPALVLALAAIALLYGALRVRTARSLAQTEQRWILALEGAGHGVWDWSPETGGLYLSPQWKAMLGYGPDELPDTIETWRGRVHPEDRAHCERELERHFQGATRAYRCAHRLRCRDGSYKWVLDQGTVFERTASGRPRRVVGTHTDISEQKRAEAALAETQTRYSELVQNTPVGIFQSSSRGHFLFVNPATARILGYPDPDAVIASYGDLARELYADPARRTEFLQTLDARGMVANFEVEVVRRDGEHRWLLLNARISARESDGSFVLDGFVNDVTERKRAEAELHRIHAELEQRVAARTRDLEAANRRLAELDRMKNLFIASMSHELRNPLNTVIGFSGMLLEGMEGDLSPAQRDYLQRVHGAGQHLLELISDVIDISKLEAGQLEASPAQVRLADVVREALDAVSAGAGRRRLALRNEVPEGLELRTDHRRLLQCLTNLLTNAVKYSDEGMVRVTARAAGNRVEVDVADTGIGIAPEAAADLFQPFVRLHSRLSVRAGGTGLGLYLARKMARELLAGDVELVESTPGEGSLFRLTVARSLTPAAKTSPA